MWGGAQIWRPFEGKSPPPSQSSREATEPRSTDAPLIGIDLEKPLLGGRRAADLREKMFPGARRLYEALAT